MRCKRCETKVGRGNAAADFAAQLCGQCKAAAAPKPKPKRKAAPKAEPDE